MYYIKYNQSYPTDVLVLIEDFDLANSTVVFDFLDSKQLEKFNSIFNLQVNIEKPSMVKIINYKQKSIKENTVYAIDAKIIETLKSENIEQINSSYLFGFSINLKNISEPIFKSAVSIGEFDKLELNSYYSGAGKIDFLDINFRGKISLIVRNVGQGNWNEILVNDNVKIVYDAGAPMNAAKDKIREYIGDKPNQYLDYRPTLFLSHWDKDHYHCLIGMTDTELSCFSNFICPDLLPNITSRLLFSKIERAIGRDNILTISNIPRIDRNEPSRLQLISPTTNNLMVFNSLENKDRNMSGIVLAIKAIKSSVVLSGDCHYYQISDYVLPLLNYKHMHNMVVPHHGGKAGEYKYNLIPCVKPKDAIISVGKKYGHPRVDYVRALKFDWFRVYNTHDVNDDIRIDL
jgi:beta-lactamase superfamily II metal-dependent hydrolase